MQHADPRSLAPPTSFHEISPEAYLGLLHPTSGRGHPGLFIKSEIDNPWSSVAPVPTIELSLPSFLDQTTFLTLNRFWRTRRNKNLAALNALYVDFDVHVDAALRFEPIPTVQAKIERRCEQLNIPGPTIFLHTGRGLAAIWLLNEVVPQARPRWSETIRTLVSLLADFAADKACTDAARVFRLPGTFNEKSGRIVRAFHGSQGRLDFETLSDQIFAAAGRPTRAELQARKTAPKSKAPPGKRRGGLTQAERFAQIKEDLEIVCIEWGGTIPEGRRMLWLHFYSVCLMHMTEVADFGSDIRAVASRVTPGLPDADVSAVIRQTAQERAGPRSNGPSDGARYVYAGATIAERLGIAEDEMRAWGLKQLITEEIRKERRNERRRINRIHSGGMNRADYLSQFEETHSGGSVTQ